MNQILNFVVVPNKVELRGEDQVLVIKSIRKKVFEFGLAVIVAVPGQIHDESVRFIIFFKKIQII